MTKSKAPVGPDPADPADLEVQECKIEGEALAAAIDNPPAGAAAGVGAPAAGVDPAKLRAWIDRVLKILDLFTAKP